MSVEMIAAEIDQETGTMTAMMIATADAAMTDATATAARALDLQHPLQLLHRHLHHRKRPQSLLLLHRRQPLQLLLPLMRHQRA